jgi:hypothetical protein
MNPKLRRLVAELISGCQVPRSLGVLGQAEAPFDQLCDRLMLFGYPDADKIEEALKAVSDEPETAGEAPAE